MFAAVLFLAHLLLPWFAIRNSSGRLRIRFWWSLIADHTLSEAALFQIGWMGVSLAGLLLVAGGSLTRRLRAMALLVIGTMGLLTAGWGAFLQWSDSTAGLIDPAQLAVLFGVATLAAAALQSSQLHAAMVTGAGPGRSAQRRAIALLGAATSLLAMMTLTLAYVAGDQGDTLFTELLPGRSATGYQVISLGLGIGLGLVGVSGLLGAPIALFGPAGPAGAAARPRAIRALIRTALWSTRMAIVASPVVVAAVTTTGGAGRGQPAFAAQYLEARLVAIYALYWFAMSIGGALFLTPDTGQDDEDRF